MCPTAAVVAAANISWRDLFSGLPPAPDPNDPRVTILADPANFQVCIARALALAVIGDEVIVKLRGER